MLFQLGCPIKKYYLLKSRKSRQFMLLTLLLSLTAISTWFGYRQIKSYFTPPEAIFVLGGDEQRERFAANLAKKHPDIPIWVSSGSPKGYVERIFLNRKIKRNRLYLDYQATDTVTNFTSLADKLQKREIHSVYLITSENHMVRARIIGEIVFGSRGILLKPISVPTKAPAEPMDKSFRDGARSILWLVTGYTGAMENKSN